MEKIIKILKDSVQLLKENDNDLIELSVHEQALSHRIAHYFENLLSNYSWYRKSSLTVDVEYNRSIYDEKTIPKEICQNCEKKKKQCYVIKEDDEKKDLLCRPDIVLHKHKTHENNILIVEIKKKATGDDKDFAKLTRFTCPEYEYKYRIGIYIGITKEKLIYKFFKDGEENLEEDISLEKIENILR